MAGQPKRLQPTGQDEVRAVARVYIPARLDMLATLVRTGEFDPISRTAFALTPALREAYTSDDDEELEAVAMAEAALASLRLLADRDEATEAQRVVIAADVPDDGFELRPDLDAAVVRLKAPVTMDQVASAHVDLTEAVDDVRRAVEVIDAADLGDEDAEFVVGDAEGHPLAWYDAAELGFLIELT